MALSDITKAAVENALAEFDVLGQESFLAKYGFQDAKRYWLVRDGKRYPSKAIAGVAHKFVSGQQLLGSPSFTGGQGTVVKRLEQLGFTVERPGRNPDWARDEVILALDLYLKHRASPPRQDSAEVAQLSALMNKMHGLIGSAGNATLRNENGIYLKMMNLRALDPVFKAQGKRGMPSYSDLDEMIWNEFSNDQAGLALEAARIRAAIKAADVTTVQKLPPGDPYVGEEGGVILRLHKRYERDPKLVARKKAAAAAANTLACEVCGFDFEKAFGALGTGYIEVHHINALHQLKRKGKTKLSELALLCANCHRIAHRRRIPLNLDDLRKALQNQVA